MPQTKFVTGKALALGLRPIVVVNKVDRPDERIQEVLDEVFDLFVSLDASDEQLDFPVLYASGRNGYANEDPTLREGTLTRCSRRSSITCRRRPPISTARSSSW
jgi:GTP-binding protein